MENGREHSFDIVDSYYGLEAINPIVKAGTEELGFFSETDTYNRDDISCIDFTVSIELRNKIERLISDIKSMKSDLVLAK